MLQKIDKFRMDLLYLLPDFWVSISRLQHPRHWSRSVGGEQFDESYLICDFTEVKKMGNNLYEENIV